MTRWIPGLALVLACAACDRQEPPAEQVADAAEEVAETAEEIVDPAATAAQAVPHGRFAPRDECAQVEGASALRSELAAAVRARDADALAALAADDILLDGAPAQSGGAAELRRRLAAPDAPLWQELEMLLSLGCAANAEGGITIPWIADQDIAGADRFSSMLVMGQGVPVYSAPDRAAATIGTVSWDVVRIDPLTPGAAFQPVILPDGARGFIASDTLRSLHDHRLTAASRNGRWSITGLVSGG